MGDVSSRFEPCRIGAAVPQSAPMDFSTLRASLPLAPAWLRPILAGLITWAESVERRVSSLEQQK